MHDAAARMNIGAARNPSSSPLLTDTAASKVSVTVGGTTYSLEKKIPSQGVGHKTLTDKIQESAVGILSRRTHTTVKIDGQKFLVKKSDVHSLLGVEAKIGMQILKSNKSDLNTIFTTDSKTQTLVRNKLKEFSKEKNIMHSEGNKLLILTQRGKVKIYNEGSHLGKGSFKTVHAYTRINANAAATPKDVAYAKARSDTDASGEIKYAKKEFKLGKDLYEKYASSHRGKDVPFVKQHAFSSDATTFGMVMEKASDLSEAGKKLNQSQKADVMLDVMRGVSFMHKAGHLHNDIKPQNILVKTQGEKHTGKICDLGLSHPTSKTLKGWGTLDYMAPEILPGGAMGLDTLGKVDSWAIGITLYQLHMGEHTSYWKAYKGGNVDRDTMIRLTEDDVAKLKPNDPVQVVIGKLLDTNPNSRWTVDAALEYLTFAKKQFGGLKIGFDSDTI